MSDYEYSFEPASYKQWLFLQSTATIVIYGGSMGGGKTYNGLLKHLKYVDNPHYRGVVVRKSSSTIMKSGFIFDEAKGIYTAFEPKVKVGYKAQKFVFPSGAEIVFTHLATDEDAELMKGSQFSFAMADEATELQEHHVLRLLSRIRSKAGIPPQLALTCNPSPDSYLRKWVDWWLYPEGHKHAGRVDPDKDGKIRWFLRIGDDMCWGDSSEELITKYGNPDLPHDHDMQVRPISVQMIGANIYDNPPLIKLNPLYLSNLLALPAVQKERDLHGNWDIRESASGFWKRDWCQELDEPPADALFDKIVRAYDFAGEMPSAANNHRCDYFASVKMGRLRTTKEFVVLDMVRTHLRFGDWEKFIIDQAKEDGKRCVVILPEDPNAAAKGATRTLVKKVMQAGFVCYPKKALRNKLDRFRLFSAACQNGFVSIVKGCGRDLYNNISYDNSFAYKELEAFDGGRKGNDDLCDCCSDSYNYLNSSQSLPSGAFLHGINAAKSETINPLLQIR